MKRAGLLVAASAAAALVTARPGPARAQDKPGWDLTFDDEFEGGTLDLSKWQRRYKWGESVVNGELEAYVDDAFTLQNGVLSIVGQQQQGQYAGMTLNYTSGIICSVLEQQYGYFEARLKMPLGQGYWPAFWLLGANGTTGVNEIDIHEYLGKTPNTVYMTVHWGQSYSVGHMSDGMSYTGPDFSADYHVFGLEWDADKIIWSIDGVERFRHTGAGVPQVKMYIILNLAIGGTWPGPPDATTPFPGLYDVDYVRAYQVAAPPPETPPEPPAALAGAGGCGCQVSNREEARGKLGVVVLLAALAVKVLSSRSGPGRRRR
jgi:beta-glucanase (GH16 family)